MVTPLRLPAVVSSEAPSSVAGISAPPAGSSEDLAIATEAGRLRAQLMERKYIAFHHVLMDIAGGFKGALMLGHALYWTRTWLSKHPERGGWFYMTQSEWKDAVGISPREQASARQVLRDSGVWEERLAGNPATLHFRVRVDVLAQRLGLTDKPSWDQLLPVLGSPVAFYKALADIAGGAAAGLLLSYYLALHRRYLLRRELLPGGFIAVPVAETETNLGIGSKTHRNARETLRLGGLISETLSRDRPPRVCVRPNLTAIVACLAGQEVPATRKRSRTAPALPASGASDRAQVVEHSGNVTQVIRLLQGSSQLRQPLTEASGPAVTVDGAKRHLPEDQTQTNQALSGPHIGPFVQTGKVVRPLVETARSVRPLITSTAAVSSHLYTKDKKQIPTTPQGSGPTVGSSSVSKTLPDSLPDTAALIAPSNLPESMHGKALALVAKADPSVQQLLLDEFEGRLTSPGARLENPLGWLFRLVQKVVADPQDVVWAHAETVAVAREARRRHEARLHAATHGGSSLPPQVSAGKPLEATAAAAAGRERLAQWRKSIGTPSVKKKGSDDE